MPYFFTVTSHIAITAALAMAVILTVVVYGFYRNGLKFLGSSCRTACPAISCRSSC